MVLRNPRSPRQSSFDASPATSGVRVERKGARPAGFMKQRTSAPGQRHSVKFCQTLLDRNTLELKRLPGCSIGCTSKQQRVAKGFTSAMIESVAAA
jgi:hypothetical protein